MGEWLVALIGVCVLALATMAVSAGITSGIRQDCELLGQFRVGDVVYICSKKKKEDK